jgi:hypothetical protein
VRVRALECPAGTYLWNDEPPSLETRAPHRELLDSL